MSAVEATGRAARELEQLDTLRELYERGLCLQALQAAEEVAPLREWTTVPGRVMAGRLAANLGAPRLCSWLQAQAYRSDRTHPEAIYFYARGLMDRKGPLRAWEFVRSQRGIFRPDSAEREAEWLAFHAYLLSLFRDFDQADRYLDRAEELDPGNPWLWVERSTVLEREDRYEEAVQAAHHALDLRPWFRPGVQAAAHTLQLLDRQQEALALLSEAAERLENAPVTGQLLILQRELGLYEEAQVTLDRLRELAPLAEEHTREWINTTASDVRYELGDTEGAILAAEASGHPFFAAVARNLKEAPPDAPRVLHAVGFVRQHHLTCGPATLTTLSRFWGQPADHLEVVAEICYDGTSDHAERHWAESHGWAAREFRMDVEASRALLDRGAPFTLTTVEPASAHLQAVIGYDARRGTFLVRDPYNSATAEFLAQETLERYASTGPRAMVLVPLAEAARLESVALPEAELYDRMYRLQRALVRHDRAAAESECAALEAAAPGHRLALHARRLIALYDGDPSASLRSVEALLELYPEDGNLQLSRLGHLRDLSRLEERLAWLESLCRPEEAGAGHPVFLQVLARELLGDAAASARCERLLRRAMSMNPTDAGLYHALGTVYWDRDERAAALELYRFGACLNDREEAFSNSYFIAARHLKETDRALAFLLGRFVRFGSRSSAPGITLFRALTQVDRHAEALEVLQQALRLRPDDGALLLFAADADGRLGRFNEAEEKLELARTRSSPAEWSRQAAQNALYAGDAARAAELWRGVLTADPLEMEAHRALAQILTASGDPGALQAHFEQYSERFPHSFALHQLWAEWARSDDQLHEKIARKLVEINPRDAWAQRELTGALGNLGRLDEAFAHAEAARQLAPTHAGYFNVYGDLCRQAGRWDEAADAFRAGVRASVDNRFALQGLLDLAPTPEARVEVMQFAAEELRRQTTFGEGLLVFRSLAEGVLQPAEIMATLRAALAARPDLWHAHTAMLRQLVQEDLLDEALAAAREITQRFPLLPGSWFELANVHRLRAERDEERQALEKAVETGPGWSPARIALARFLEREGDAEGEVRVLEANLPRDPLDVRLHTALASALWRVGEKGAALIRIKQAIRIDPDHEPAWELFAGWCDEEGRPYESRELAREMALRRPRSPEAWLILARALDEPQLLEERLQALDRALELNPRLVEAYDLKLELLAEAERWEAIDQLAAALPWHPEARPVEIRARLAWVEERKGNRDAAIAAMQETVRDAPGHYWGWLKLAQWTDAAGRNAEYLQATEQMVRLAPHDAGAHGLLGDAALRAGDRARAKNAWRRAVEIAPDYRFALYSLFDVQLEDGEWDAAEGSLERMLRSPHRGWGFDRALRLAAARKDEGALRDFFRRLCLTPDASSEALSGSARRLTEGGWTRMLDQVYNEVLFLPEVNPVVGSLWIKRCTDRGEWSCARKLDALLEKGEIGVAAVSTYLMVAGEKGRAREVHRLVNRHREALREATWPWGAAGAALFEIRGYRACAEWMADWRERSDAEGWALLNLALALRHLRREPEAREVSRAALELPPDSSTVAHRTWLAFDTLLAGAATGAELRELRSEEAGSYYRFLQALALALALRAEKPGDFSAMRRQVGAARAAQPNWWRDVLLRRAMDATVVEIARSVNTPAAHLWALHRFFRLEWA